MHINFVSELTGGSLSSFNCDVLPGRMWAGPQRSRFPSSAQPPTETKAALASGLPFADEKRGLRAHVQGLFELMDDDASGRIDFNELQVGGSQIAFVSLWLCR